MITTLWIAIGAGTLLLLVAAAKRKEEKKCVGVYISIHGVSNNFFVDKKDIMDSIEAIVGTNPTGKRINSFDLEKIEKGLTGNIWVKSAQLFFDNNEKLQVNVLEREPVARIFTRVGTTFYIDSSIKVLPLSEKFSARLPVFTDFPSDKALVKADSDLLTDIKNISLAVQKDSFAMAIIDQIDITSQRTFEMVPKIGNQIIVFGDATDINEKLNRLQLFYKKVITKTGWSYYSTIDLEYKDQVVAKRKGAEDRAIDSLKTLQLMQVIVSNAKRLSEDSAQITTNDNEVQDSSTIQRSLEREDETENTDTATVQQSAPQSAPPVVKPVVKPEEKVKEIKPIVKVEKPVSKPTKEKVPVKKPEVKPKDITVSPKEKKKDPVVIKKQVTQKQKTTTEIKPAVVKPKPVSISPKEKAKNNDY
jgi:cell division protein FtsQ